jgi:membrane-associated phospholipid phosphatase
MRSNKYAANIATALVHAYYFLVTAVPRSISGDGEGTATPVSPQTLNILFSRLLLASTIFFCILSGRPAESADTVGSAGDVVTVLLPATAGIATLALKDHEGTVQLVKSMTLALSATIILKYSVNEKRPNGENYSFPSGHSAIAFSSAEAIRNRYGWEYGIPAYAAASFVAYSRVEAREHYFHDVLAGAVIGAASSYLFTTPYKGLNISSEAAPGYLGVHVSSNW